MRRVQTCGLVVLVLFTGCPESREVDARRDAGVDAPLRMDTGSDVPGCTDADSDGLGSPACGGSDCDDGDPSIGAFSSECLGATASRICDAGAVSESACPGSVPACDLRTGSCAPDACGDGVLHPGEECDDGNDDDDDLCTTTCRDVPCTGSTECPPGRESCSDRREDGNVYCQPLREEGEPLGARCTEDSECDTGWCDSVQSRCTAACDAPDDCAADLSFCLNTVLAFTQPFCGFGCRTSQDCADGTLCLLDFIAAGVPVSYCVPPQGTLLPGEGCRSSFDCSTNACVLFFGCTILCADDADCETDDASGPHCGAGVSTPPDWSVERLSFCISEGRTP